MMPIAEIRLLNGIRENTLQRFFRAKTASAETGDPIKSVPIKRSIKLLVPSVSYANNEGCLNNDYWAYKVPYAFRDALDIRFTNVVKNKQTTSIWTQGGLLAFSIGDFFESASGGNSIQVVSAKPMLWDTNTGVFDSGDVTYQFFVRRGLGMFFTVSQVDFLQLLIVGKVEE